MTPELTPLVTPMVYIKPSNVGRVPGVTLPFTLFLDRGPGEMVLTGTVSRYE